MRIKKILSLSLFIALSSKMSYALIIEGSPNEWISSKQILKIIVEDNDTAKYLKLPNGNLIMPKYNNYYMISENGDYTFEVLREDDSLESETLTIDKFDTEKPSLSYSKSYDILNNELNISYQGIDSLSGVSKVINPNGEDGVDTFKAMENGEYVFTVYDNVGNVHYESIYVTEIQKRISPIKAFEYKLGGATTTNWADYTSPIKIENEGVTLFSVRAFDEAGNNDFKDLQVVITGGDFLSSISGIDRIEYKLDGATSKEWTPYTDMFNISTDGVTFLTVRAYDKAGNMALETSEIIIGNKDFNASGIDRIEYNITGSNAKWTVDGEEKTGWIEYENAFNIEGEGIVILRAIAYDNAGNIGEDSAVIQLRDISLNSGIERIEYKLEGATELDWTLYENTFLIENPGITIIKALGYDYAGNIAEATSFAQIRFKNASKIERIEYKLEGATELDWTEVNMNDDSSGMVTISEEGITKIIVRAYDQAGNISEEYESEVKIDLTSPINSHINLLMPK